MLHFSRSYTFAILAICLLGILLPIPNFLSKERYDALPSFAQHKIGLGLDLRGGAHLLTAMDMDELRKDWMLSVADQAKTKLREAKLGFTAVGPVGPGVQIRLAKTEPADIEAALKALRPIAQPSIGLAGSGAADLEVKSDGTGTISLTPTEAGLNERASQAISTAVEIIRRRLDPDGVKEVAVQRQGRDRILVQQPGVETEKELNDIREKLRQAAKMTFHLVHPTMSAEEAKATRVPAGYMLVPSAERDPTASGPPPDELVEIHPLLTGAQLSRADPAFDQQTNQPIISFGFNSAGALTFGKVSAANVGRRFAVVLDGKVITAPRIQTPILSGEGQITGNFTTEETQRLSTLLKSGALPAKLTVVEERVVGASLGQDSIDSGKRAALIGMLGVAAFMIFAYGLFGVFAVIGAAMHVVLVIAIMTLIGSTMTLPGIAGVVLTIGMAVDANVLIYERIREELRNQKSPIAAIDAGFARAYATIIDSQLTTFIAGLLMFLLGAGPIRGFAVTLTLGILTTVFTAFTVTRLLVAWWVASQRTRKFAAPL